VDISRYIGNRNNSDIDFNDYTVWFWRGRYGLDASSESYRPYNKLRRKDSLRYDWRGSLRGNCGVMLMAELTLSSLLPDILGRIEENNPPVFWSLTGEVYPAMVDGIFEAALITGVVQLVSQQITLAADTTYFSLQASGEGYGQGGYGQGGYGGSVIVPVGIIAPLRMKAPYGIRKTSLKSLDDTQPNWEQWEPGTQIIAWGPLGVSGFFIWPQLTQPQNVVMDFLFSPINQARPLTGNEPIPLQQEFTDILSKYAAAQLRVKEGGQEAEEADTVFQEYLAEVKDLSMFQQRLDSVVYSSAYGARSQVNPRTVV
jgi:hypothetical protein